MVLEYLSDFGMNVRRRGFNNMGWPGSAANGRPGLPRGGVDDAGKPFPMPSNAFTNFSNDGTFITHTYTMTFRPDQGRPRNWS